MIADLDESDLGLSSDDEQKEESGGGWDDSDSEQATPPVHNGDDDLVDNWEEAPDYAELERQKKEAEEAKKKAEEEAAAAERQRKEMKKLMREQAKKIKDSLQAQDSDDDEGGLFDVDIAREQQAQQDFKMARDIMGDFQMDDENIEVKDIMTFRPETVGDFEALRKELVNIVFSKVTLKSKDIAPKIGSLIRALIDDYKSQQMKAIDTLLINLSNERLHQNRLKQGKKDKKQVATTNKAFFNAKDDGGDDDFM